LGARPNSAFFFGGALHKGGLRPPLTVTGNVFQHSPQQKGRTIRFAHRPPFFYAVTPQPACEAQAKHIFQTGGIYPANEIPNAAFYVHVFFHKKIVSIDRYLLFLVGFFIWPK
jgi:hypothetical protein